MTTRTTKHVPLRRCVVCRASLPKERLIRFTRSEEEGAWRLDASRRTEGRGTWVCEDCARAADRKRFTRAFRGQTDAVVDQLHEHLTPESLSDGGTHG